VARVYVIVEGPTEESFVKDLLGEALWRFQVFLTPIIVGVPGHKGGRTSYARVEKDILAQLRQDRGSYCTTMIDYYGLGRGFPGMPVPGQLGSLQKVEHIERAVKDDICKKIPDFRPDTRLIPYLSLHEYEGLLFSDPETFARSIGQPSLSNQFRQIRDDFPTPENINNDPQTAPSKRVIESHPAYRKVIQGTIAARAIGIPRMREECAHFRSWFERLEALPSL
jgi:Domain of unknown function (DUF4276)